MLVAWQSDRWILRHHPAPAPLAGWFQLESARHVQGPAEFTREEAEEFGSVLSACSEAIRRVTGALRVYAIAFGEGAPHLHMHLIPRMSGRDDTAAWKVADWYRRVEADPALAASPEKVLAVISEVEATLLQLSPPGGPWPTPTES